MSDEKDTEQEVFVIENVPKFADELRDSVIYQMIDSGELPKPKTKKYESQGKGSIHHCSTSYEYYQR